MAADGGMVTGPGGRLDALVEPVYLPVLAVGLVLQVAGLAAAGIPAAASGPALALALAGVALGGAADLVTSDERHELRGRLRRFGLGVVQRVSVRALLLTAVAVAVEVVAAVTVAYVLAILVVVAAARLVGYALGKIVQLVPATAERNLAADLPLGSTLARLRDRRLTAIGVVCVGEVPLGLALALGTGGQATAGLVVLAVVAGALGLGAVGVALWARRLQSSHAIDRYVDGLREAIAATGSQVVVYFSGDPLATYQLKQWMPVIERLRTPVLLLLRERSHLDELEPTRWPVVVAPRHRDVEVALACDPRVVLYVANAGRNLHFLRYGRPKHVFLNHGDSDKASSANPVVKVYDRLFVAGEVGIERYRAAGIDLPDHVFSIVGRPQLDGVLDRRRKAEDGPPTLLYAPTWEGFFDTADYSSLERLGEDLVTHVLERHPGVRIVFKPHPASGTVRPSALAARQRVTALLREAGAPHVLAEDVPERDLLTWFDHSDVLLADISAVVTDFLQTDKPYLVTNPRGLPLADFHAQFPSHRAAAVVAPDLADFDALLDDAFGPDERAEARATMKRAVLGEHPDGPQAAFEAALAEVIAWAERDADRVVNTFAYELE